MSSKITATETRTSTGTELALTNGSLTVCIAYTDGLAYEARIWIAGRNDRRINEREIDMIDLEAEVARIFGTPVYEIANLLA